MLPWILCPHFVQFAQSLWKYNPFANNPSSSTGRSHNSQLRIGRPSTVRPIGDTGTNSGSIPDEPLEWSCALSMSSLVETGRFGSWVVEPSPGANSQSLMRMSETEFRSRSSDVARLRGGGAGGGTPPSIGKPGSAGNSGKSVASKVAGSSNLMFMLAPNSGRTSSVDGARLSCSGKAGRSAASAPIPSIMLFE